MLRFTIDGEQHYMCHRLNNCFYRAAGIGFGEVPLDPVKVFFDMRNARLQVSDTETDYERELSRIGYALHIAKGRGITVVSVDDLLSI